MNEQEKEALKRVASHYGIAYCEDLDIKVKYLSEPKPPHPVVVRQLPPPKLIRYLFLKKESLIA
jgi:hypothetical protein